MRRQTSYIGELPLVTDFLLAQQNTMVAIGELIQSLCGTSTFVTGLTCTPTTPTASLQVVLGAGCIYQSEPIEATTWSALNASTANNIMKQGIALNAQTLPTFTPPSTAGQSQNFLIEVQYQDSDINSTVLPYFNPAILTTPGAANWAGPGNSGASQATQRDGILAYQIKAGVAAATGTQTTPSADTGWTGLYVITLANGQTQITSSSIAVAAGAPFLPSTLNNIANYIQSGAATAVTDTGAANALAIAPVPAPASITAGMAFKVKVGHTLTSSSTLAVTLASGTQTNAITRADASATQAGDLIAGQEVELTFDGAEWQIPRAISALTRTPVNDANHTVASTDRTVAWTAITAARTAPLPAAAAYPTGETLLLMDESGNASTSNTITPSPNGGDTINPSSQAVIKAAYGFLALKSNGSNKWTVVGQDMPSFIANLPTSLPGATHTPWNDGGVISTT